MKPPLWKGGAGFGQPPRTARVTTPPWPSEWASQFACMLWESCPYYPLNTYFADGHTVVENTGSLLTSEVKRHRARLVLGWGTAWEDLWVLSAFPIYIFGAVVSKLGVQE